MRKDVGCTKGFQAISYVNAKVFKLYYTATHTNLTHCFLATGVEPIGEQHLDNGEDIKVRIFSRNEVLDMLRQGEVWQSLMAAPLWKYFAENKF